MIVSSQNGVRLEKEALSLLFCSLKGFRKLQLIGKASGNAQMTYLYLPLLLYILGRVNKMAVWQLVSADCHPVSCVYWHLVYCIQSHADFVSDFLL